MQNKGQTFIDFEVQGHIRHAHEWAKYTGRRVMLKPVPHQTTLTLACKLQCHVAQKFQT